MFGFNFVKKVQLIQFTWMFMVVQSTEYTVRPHQHYQYHNQPVKKKYAEVDLDVRFAELSNM